jgi:5-methylcytosine-specific restriction enzyme A
MIKAKAINEKLGLNAKHSLYRKDGKWYHHLKAFPGILFDEDGYVVFQQESDYFKNEFLQHGQDLHVSGGICKMTGYKIFSAEQKRQLTLL